MAGQLLWADGESEFTVIGQQYITACGYDVVTTADAVECLRQLKCLIPDVLVLDDELLWGGMDGILTWLRDEVSVNERPVVVVSGDASPEAMSAKTGIPAVRCLQKPYRLQTILEAVAAESTQRQPVDDELYETVLEGAP